MSQIIESRFRVLEFDTDDVLINDIADTGLPVHVNKNRDGYSDNIQDKIDKLEPGNIIEAEIQSESIARQDDTWKFIQLNITDQTRFHFLENADNHSSHVSELAQMSKKSSENAARTTITSDGQTLGYLTVAQDMGDRFWNGLRSGTNTHEFDIQNLKSISEPPYEVIYSRTSDEDLLVFYHLVERNTEIAQKVISANN